MKLTSSIILPFILCFFFSINAIAQVSSTSTRTIDENTKVYDKGTQKRLDYEKVREIIQNNPNVAFENEINERGEIVALIYNPNNNGRITRDESLRTKPNEEFPYFIFETIGGEIINSKELTGKTIILYFNLYLKSPFINEKSISDFNNLITSAPGEVLPVMLTVSSEEEISDFISQVNIPFSIVPDARNFMEKFIVTDFPSYIVINKDGTLGAYVKDLEDVKEILKL